jgi:hypothetical protein
MDNEQDVSKIITRIDLEISYLKKELANTPKGRSMYTHAQLLFAKIGMLNEAKAIVLSNQHNNNHS